MKIKTLLALLLVAAFVVSLTACDNGTAESLPPSDSSATVSEDTCPLPDVMWNEQLTILGIEQDKPYIVEQWAPAEMNEEPVNDATFERNSLIEEKYGITLSAGFETSYDKVVATIATNVDAGADDYDIVSCAAHYLAVSSASQGYLYDLNTIQDDVGEDYLDLTGEWWDQTAVRDLSIAHALYYATGDICVTDNTATWAIYYNKDIAQENGLGNLYEVVRSGDWTLDTMYTNAKQAVRLVGGEMDFSATTEDTWGLITQSYDTLATMLGCAQPMSVKDADDIPQFRVSDERNLEVFDKVLTILLDETVNAMADFHGRWDSGVYTTAQEMFCNGHGLFFYGALSTVDGELMRNAEIHYGILPMAKADELQEDYSSSATVYHLTVVGIPISTSETLPCSVFAMEAMAYYGREMVTEVYYTKTLKNKRFEDNDSPEMLDIIVRNRTYDISTVYNWGDALYMYTSQLGAKNNTLVSAAEAALLKMETARDATVEAITSQK